MVAYVTFSEPVNDYFTASSCSIGTSIGGGYLAGSGSVTAQLHGMQFTKGRDSLSDALMQHCAAGTVFSTVLVELCKDADSDPYLTYTLSSVVISSVNSGGSGEYVGLDYSAAKGSYAG
jgi:type VI protein secretion system component Hcp